MTMGMDEFFESLILCVCIYFPSSLELQGLSYRLQKLQILTKLQSWQQSILETKNSDLSNSFKHVFCHLDHPVLSHSCLKRITLCPTACRKFGLVSTYYWEFLPIIYFILKTKIMQVLLVILLVILMWPSGAKGEQERREALPLWAFCHLPNFYSVEKIRTFLPTD